MVASIPIIIPEVPLPSFEKLLLPPIAIKLSCAPPTIVSCLFESAVPPTKIFESPPSNLIAPSPILIDASVELISILFAFNSKFLVAISTSVSNLKCP